MSIRLVMRESPPYDEVVLCDVCERESPEHARVCFHCNPLCSCEGARIIWRDPPMPGELVGTCPACHTDYVWDSVDGKAVEVGA